MKYLFYIVILIISVNQLQTQAIVVDRISKTAIKPDSLFEVFVEPDIPKTLLNANSKEAFYYEFLVMCLFSTDTSNTKRIH
jgi:hypothetical protein